LQDACPSDGNVPEAAGTLGDSLLSRGVQLINKSAAEASDLSERVRLAALINYGNICPFLHLESVGFEVPLGIRMSSGRYVEQIQNRSGKSKGDILAEVGPKHIVKRFRIAFIERNNLRYARRCFFIWLDLLAFCRASAEVAPASTNMASRAVSCFFISKFLPCFLVCEIKSFFRRRGLCVRMCAQSKRDRDTSKDVIVNR